MTTHNKAFCVLPWLHLHVMPDSSVIPCCVSPYHEVYGNVSTERVEDIWNNEKFRLLREQMLIGEMPSGCNHCHTLEKSGFSSMRTNLNFRFAEDIPRFIEHTSADGHYTELKLKYIDIRFSNLCNFKCRGCGPTLSSSWFDDHNAIFDYQSEKPRVSNIAGDSPSFWKKFQELVMSSEFIYFGGGEPLITKEHFDLLRLLIAKGRTHVDLSYNTNISTLTYGNHNLPELWKNFKSATLGISLDDLAERAEYFRSGTKWRVIESNMRKLRDEYVEVGRYVNCTVSLMNIYYLPELFSYLVEEKIITPKDFNINLLLEPQPLRADVAPAGAKKAIKEKLERFITKLKVAQFFKAADDFRNVITFMEKTDHSELFPQFLDYTQKLDTARGESFSRTYPELYELLGLKENHEATL